jgi:hypothetical protein
MFKNKGIGGDVRAIRVTFSTENIETGPVPYQTEVFIASPGSI